MDTETQNQFVFDVLPSFEMYHSFQYSTPRHSLDNSVEHDFPPDYFNHRHDHDQSCAASISCSESLITTGTSFTTPSISTRLDNDSTSLFANTSVSAPATSANTASSSAPASAPAPPPAATTSEFAQEIEQNIIDKSHILPNVNSFDVEIDVRVTKDVPVPHQTPEMESMLKEYTSGDVVHGYVVVNNTSDQPVPFEMFHVTLEGYVSIVDPDKKKQILKRFLTMVDLSASWSSGCISPSANISFEPHTKDHDGCYLGLKNDRILEPHTKYKKFFTFKFPYNLLDNVCRHQQEVHTLLPPSFGVDRIKKRGKYSNIEFNPVTNYGHLGYAGSPILTNDMSQPDLSVSYGINAKLIGTSPKHPSKLVILKDYEYALRFIPFGFAVPLCSAKKNYNSMCETIEHDFKNAERAMELSIEGGNVDEVEQLDYENKSRQLSLTSVPSANTGIDYNFPLRNKNFGNADDSKVETQLTYILNRNVGKSSFMNKLKSNKPSSSSITRSGLVKISTAIPKDGLPYKSPSLLRKTNEVSNLSKVGLKNYDTLSSSLSMNEKKKLTSLNLKFRFIPSDNSLDLAPPEIKSIKPSLIALNVLSSCSIPIKLSPGLLKPQEFNKLKSKFQGFYDTYLELESKCESNKMDMEHYLDSTVLQDIMAMKDLKVEKFTLPVFDHSIARKTQWEVNPSGANNWEKVMDLSLNFKDDIPETLIPNFQSCLLARLYCINVDIIFKNGQSCDLMVPIRVRKFDDF